MARVPLIERGAADEAQEAFLSRVAPLNLFKALANAPKVAAAARELGRVILFETRLDRQLRELVILRTAHRAACAYELAQHERISRDLDIPEEKIQATKVGPSAEVFNLLERAALRLADEIADTGRVTPQTYQAVRAYLDDQQMVELTMTAGYYAMIAVFLETMDVDLEGPGFTEGVKVK